MSDRVPPHVLRARLVAQSLARGVACGIVLVGATLAVDIASAQTSDASTSTTLPSVAVTATRQTQPIREVLADITVIGPEEIARSGAQGLADLLQRQPGVEIVQNGGPGAVSGVFLRGANSNQTLVLVDGIRLASSTSGATALEAIPLDQIERIEILRGPASSLYGADAIGGVVQVFTRRGSGAVSGNVSAGYGTYNTWDAKAGIAGGTGPFQFALQGAAKASKGFNAIADPANFLYNPDPDGYSNQSVTASAGVTFAPDQEASVQYFRSHLNNKFDGGPDSDDRTITVDEVWQVVSRNRLASSWVSRLSAGQGIDDSTTQSGFGNSTFNTTQSQFAWQNELALPVGALTAGYERREERVDTDQGFATTSRNTNSLFAIYQLRADAHALQANLRYDDNSQYGGKTTGAIAYSYLFPPGLRLTAGYSTGFKAPTFNDLYYPGFSNPDLVPETSRNFEVGAYWNTQLEGAAYELRAVAYHNQIEQMIVFSCDASFVCAPVNVDRATLEGVTLGLDARFEAGATIAASLDLQSPTNDRNGNLLPRRARQHGAVRAGYPLGPVRLGMEYVASSLRYDDPANLVKMGGYGIVNLTAEWYVGRDITLFARANNVFDKNYELAAGYATGGATLFAGIRAVIR